jgi:hypothetical protein
MSYKSKSFKFYNPYSMDCKEHYVDVRIDKHRSNNGRQYKINYTYKNKCGTSCPECNDSNPFKGYGIIRTCEIVKINALTTIMIDTLLLSDMELLKMCKDTQRYRQSIMWSLSNFIE